MLGNPEVVEWVVVVSSSEERYREEVENVAKALDGFVAVSVNK